ncbi:MAG: 30S ribosomal protein S20 [Actinomycetia bacterium]|nr:30S ribosomal protein S20 [Actinomycetes bacterium]MCQ3805283.1 30S ribosomal protein S20 [Acidimicrobiia bacterium]MCY4650200.1 30S ribosomal protein S20 [bacterium]
MANIKSQEKRNRQNERRRLANKSIRSEMKTRIKSALEAAESGDPDTDLKLRLAQRRIDSACSKGVIHANKAARLKSRLFREVASAL